MSGSNSDNSNVSWLRNSVQSFLQGSPLQSGRGELAANEEESSPNEKFMTESTVKLKTLKPEEFVTSESNKDAADNLENTNESHYELEGDSSSQEIINTSPSLTAHDETETSQSTKARTFNKLLFDPKASQQNRRELALARQRERRDEFLEKIRQLEGDTGQSDSDIEDEEDFVLKVKKDKLREIGAMEVLMEENEGEAAERMDIASKPSNRKRYDHRQSNRKNSKRNPPCRVMLSEWLEDKPEDLEENWMGVLCPVGKRCIVVACSGKTRVFSRVNEYMGAYQSSLPGGRKYNYHDSTCNRTKGVTVLDCIWSDQTQTFYVLDLVCWNSHACNNCDTECREYILRSKFAENISMMESNHLNPFPFILLPKFNCDQISEAMTISLPIFPQKVDGLLFLHKQAFYIQEANPLCLWIYLTDVEKKLGLSVSPELLDFQKKHEKKKRRPQPKAMELDG